MNDLISRQGAIDAALTVIVEYCGAAFDEDMQKMLCKRLDDLPSAEPQWIPVSERLPEDDRSKVVTLANGNAEVGYYSNGDWWCVGDEVTLENQTVIAWMPLPNPYKGDKG